MTRNWTFALIGVCALALNAAPLLAKGAPAAPSSAKSAPGSEPLNVGETPEEAQEHGDGVAAIVNDTVISDYDLRQRVALFIATSGVRPTADSMKQIRGQVLQTLETERIELLEAQKNNVSVSASDVDKSIDTILKDNHVTQDQMNLMLGHANVHMATLRGQIAAQIAWSKTVQNQYGDRIDVSPQDVDAELQRLAEGKNKTHYVAAEIFQSVDNPEDDGKVLKNMQDLETQLRAGAPFPTVARQFSQNPTAASGGDLGVVVDGQLPRELNDALAKLRPGSISDPIKSTGGYYILYLRARIEGANVNIPDPKTQVDEHPSSLPLARVLLPLNPKSPKDLIEKVAQAANNIRSHIESCEMLPELAKQIKGLVYMNLGTMKLSDLSPEMQSALAQSEPGEPTPVFQSAAGIEIIVRCDKAVPQLTGFHMPSRDDVEQQIFEERMSVLSRQYLRDLRRDADIELPGQSLFAPHKAADASAQK
jgi:peptidyl-prolyl cis-trans isomerase SurA